MKILRLLNGESQWLVAARLNTKQANVAMLEAGKFKINSKDLQYLSDLYGVRPEWLMDGVPPVFNESLNVFSISPNPNLSKKIINSIDNAIRKYLPDILQDSQINKMVTIKIEDGPTEEINNPMPPNMNARIIVYYSQGLRYLLIFKIVEYDSKQFSDAFDYVNNKARIECSTRVHPYQMMREMIMTDKVTDETVASLEGILWGVLNLQDEEIINYIRQYRSFSRRTERHGFLSFSHDLMIAEIAELMEKYNITLNDLKTYKKKNK